MSDPVLSRILRETRLAEALQPPDALRQIEATQRVIDQTGEIMRPAVQRHLPPQDLHWSPGDGGARRAVRAGRLALLAAYAATAPVSGTATVTYTVITQLGSSDTVTLSIPVGERFADSSGRPITMDVPAGSVILAQVTTANGASNVSMFATLEYVS